MDKSTRDIKYPSFHWPRSGWWFTVIGAVVGVGYIVYPRVVQLTLPNRAIVGAGITLAPGVLVLASFLLRAIRVFVNRARTFSQILQYQCMLEEKLGCLQELIRLLLSDRTNKAYVIDHCYDYENRTVIALKKKPGPSLSVGQAIAVIDQKDAAPLGKFVVTRSDTEFYLCEVTGYMDPLWLGYVKQAGTTHSQASPSAVAVAIPNGSGR